MKRHDTDVVSLVFGLLFLAGTGWWALDRLTDLDTPAGWPLATALLVAGAVGLLSTLPRRRAAKAERVGVPGSVTDGVANSDLGADARPDGP